MIGSLTPYASIHFWLLQGQTVTAELWSHLPLWGNHINIQCVQKEIQSMGNAYIIATHGFSSCFSKNGVNTSRENINCSKLHPFLFMGIFKEHCAFKSLSYTGRVTGQH